MSKREGKLLTDVQTVTLIIFVIAIGLVVSRVISSVVGAVIGVVALVVSGSISDVTAFGLVDWNVIIILLSIWLIATYFGKTGVPEWLAEKMLEMSKGNLALFVVALGTLAGLVSMLIDNVVIILMFAPVLMQVSRRFKFASFAPILFLGLCANFMGTALLLGDLPPQLLHSVSGIEFSGFLWLDGKPSSFIMLTITYLIVVTTFYFVFKKFFKNRRVNVTREEGAENPIKNPKFAFLVCFMFLATVLLMAFRQFTGLHLGFLAFAGAVTLVLLIEILKGPWNIDVPSFEEILGEISWDAIFFYSSLFCLVGALEHVGIIQIVANWLSPFFKASLLGGVSLLYWVTAPIVGVVEHDAYILAMLYIIRDFAQSTGISAWPFYWGLLFAGTLGSNLTIAGAPALYVALSMAEKEDGRKVPLGEFLRWSAPYVFLSLAICFVVLLAIWVIPAMH
ncbi:MAG TPA: permease [Desulfotomaculum sp.]|nr:permease [Desulfotomaculum sp.]HBY04956.1 permease [Desulfotomaculum sp.]